MDGELKIAVDIGGTFTDFVLLRENEMVAAAKLLTTYPDPSVGVEEGITKLMSDRDPGDVGEVIHGTTLVSNALIERKGVRTALITTEGFRDVLSSGRELRYDLYDLFLEQPEPLVARRYRYTVAERILADGSVDRALDPEDVRKLLPALRRSGVEAVAVCLLHSYRYPAHEQAVGRLLADELPGVAVSLSSEVSPEIGEFHRMSTTAANAYVLPVVDSYLSRLQDGLVDAGIRAPLHVMLSTGGLATTDIGRRFPVRMLESGPAAGVLSAAFFGSGERGRDVLAFDMGGTTAKAGLIQQGTPLIAPDHEAARVYRFTKGSGLPIHVPVIDLIEIGAGGGSIARVGPFGLTKVGPDSAANDPGPACYGLGGTEPTVTDADLALGYLNPDFFLGGEIELDVSGANRALAKLGEGLGLSFEKTSSAIHRVVNENMANAARMHAIERGIDLRSFTLVATGGAGPVHAWGVARALDITRIVYPPKAGVASAFGMLTAPPAFEFARSAPSLLANLDWPEARAFLGELVEEGRKELAATGRDPEQIKVGIWADVRYQGQGGSITVAVGADVADTTALAIDEAFRAEYLRVFGSQPPDVDPELLTWRVRVAGERPRPTIPVGDAPTEGMLKGHRPIWLTEESAFGDAAVYDRDRLRPGATISGPAVVEERESTVVIGSGGIATVDGLGNLEVEVNG